MIKMKMKGKSKDEGERQGSSDDKDKRENKTKNGREEVGMGDGTSKGNRARTAAMTHSIFQFLRTWKEDTRRDDENICLEIFPEIKIMFQLRNRITGISYN